MALCIVSNRTKQQNRVWFCRSEHSRTSSQLDRHIYTLSTRCLTFPVAAMTPTLSRPVSCIGWRDTSRPRSSVPATPSCSAAAWARRGAPAGSQQRGRFCLLAVDLVEKSCWCEGATHTQNTSFHLQPSQRQTRLMSFRAQCARFRNWNGVTTLPDGESICIFVTVACAVHFGGVLKNM